MENISINIKRYNVSCPSFTDVVVGLLSWGTVILLFAVAMVPKGQTRYKKQEHKWTLLLKHNFHRKRQCINFINLKFALFHLRSGMHCSWYHDEMNQTDCEQLLLKFAPGTFLIRMSETRSGEGVHPINMHGFGIWWTRYICRGVIWGGWRDRRPTAVHVRNWTNFNI